MSDNLERRGKAVPVSVEILAEMLRTGWQTPTDSVVRCIDGLPGNAELLSVEMSSRHRVSFVFVCPDWPVVEVGTAWPEFTPLYQSEWIGGKGEGE